MRSSLDNLESEQVPAAARTYLDRARQGSERLGAIVLAMGAATRVEESIGSAERVRFDLVPVLASAVGAYRAAFPARGFQFECTAGTVSLDGRPGPHRADARQAHRQRRGLQPRGLHITVRMRDEGAAALIEVDNAGPHPAPGGTRLFESLWQSRPGSDGLPHLGLGLYIVRLIAEFHGGEASAANLADGSGVLSVRLPR